MKTKTKTLDDVSLYFSQSYAAFELLENNHTLVASTKDGKRDKTWKESEIWKW